MRRESDPDREAMRLACYARAESLVGGLSAREKHMALLGLFPATLMRREMDAGYDVHYLCVALLQFIEREVRSGGFDHGGDDGPEERGREGLPHPQ